MTTVQTGKPTTKRQRSSHIQIKKIGPIDAKTTFQSALLPFVIKDSSHPLNQEKKIKKEKSDPRTFMLVKETLCKVPHEWIGDHVQNQFLRLSSLAKHCHKFVGAHVSVAGGVENAVLNAVHIGAQSFALFLKSQRKWDNPPLTLKNIKTFREWTSLHGFDGARCILPHGSYLVNLGNPEPEKLKRSRECFLEDVQRCEALGIRLYNFHPGSAVGNCDRIQCIQAIAEGINQAHALSSTVVCVVENMSGQGNTLGGAFEDLSAIISQVHDKSRVGICLDTCHLFAYGYDIRTSEKFTAVLKEFDRIVGRGYLHAMHINDCQSALGSHSDRHANIGKGQIGLDAFRFIMNNDWFNDLPLILETPVSNDACTTYRQEIDLLYSLVNINQCGEKSEQKSLCTSENLVVKTEPA